MSLSVFLTNLSISTGPSRRSSSSVILCLGTDIGTVVGYWLFGGRYCPVGNLDGKYAWLGFFVEFVIIAGCCGCSKAAENLPWASLTFVVARSAWLCCCCCWWFKVVVARPRVLGIVPEGTPLIPVPKCGWFFKIPTVGCGGGWYCGGTCWSTCLLITCDPECKYWWCCCCCCGWGCCGCCCWALFLFDMAANLAAGRVASHFRKIHRSYFVPLRIPGPPPLLCLLTQRWTKLKI